jgi:hypothetical protein
LRKEILMPKAANTLENYRFIDDQRRSFFCYRRLSDEFQKIEMKNRSLTAQSLKYEMKNPSWIRLLKDEILAA